MGEVAPRFGLRLAACGGLNIAIVARSMHRMLLWMGNVIMSAMSALIVGWCRVDEGGVEELEGTGDDSRWGAALLCLYLCLVDLGPWVLSMES